MSKPLLSAVIPTWNRAHIVCEAIESALNQRAGQVEVIVVDDCSTDATLERVKKTFGSCVHVLQMATRCGQGTARNAGALLASGEFVGFLDSDDVWLPGKLDAELRVFAEHPTAIAVISDSQNFFEGQRDAASRFTQNGLFAATQGRVRLVDDCDWMWTNSTITAHMCGITVRRTALAKLGLRLFAEDLSVCEDWEFQMRLYSLGPVAVLPNVYSSVRRFNDGSRLGRSIPGQEPTREQEIALLRARLTVMERSQTWLHDLRADLAAELERFRRETEDKLSQLTVKVMTA
ncbi:MAG TPA: glycosyltransferase family 2 protein [Pyrinomonadaceae bacterium]|nr:glycosyltransferase family 2 protein [Pyrinomonadaceae bacterium]